MIIQVDDSLVCKSEQTGSHGAANAAPLTPTLPHQFRVEKELSSVLTMAQAAPSTPTSYITVAHKLKRREIKVRPSCLSCFPFGSQSELGQTFAQDFPFAQHCPKNCPCRAQEKEDHSSIVCSTHHLHSHIVCEYFFCSNSECSCQPEDTTTIDDAVSRTSLHPCPPTYPSEIVPGPHEGLVDPRKNEIQKKTQTKFASYSFYHNLRDSESPACPHYGHMPPNCLLDNICLDTTYWLIHETIRI